MGVGSLVEINPQDNVSFNGTFSEPSLQPSREMLLLVPQSWWIWETGQTLSCGSRPLQEIPPVTNIPIAKTAIPSGTDRKMFELKGNRQTTIANVARPLFHKRFAPQKVNPSA